MVPIFHNVYPLPEMNQTDTFWNAFSELEELYKRGSEILKWRKALEEAANLEDGINSNDFW